MRWQTNDLTIIPIQAREEIFKQRIINRSALGMILHAQRKGMIPQADLLDDAIA